MSVATPVRSERSKRPASLAEHVGPDPRREAGAVVHVVLNGAAGNREDEPVLAALAAAAGPANASVVLHRPEAVRSGAAAPSLADAADAAARAAGPGGVLVAVGGDGTVNTVARAAMQHGAVLGVLPRGTFNVFARRHALPEDAASAARALFASRPRPVQVGQLNGRRFFVNASLGLYPRLLEDREAFEARVGRSRWAAVLAGIGSLLREHRPLALKITADGAPQRLVEASTLFVANNAVQVQALGLPRAGHAGAGALAAIALRAVTPWERLVAAGRGALGRLADAEGALTHFNFRRLEVRPPARHARRATVKVALDGEVTRLPWPLAFTIDEQPLWLLAPPEPGAA
jgi:diacylglycerol kinase family enzyme